jgi:small subunit ribosomal protein S21
MDQSSVRHHQVVLVGAGAVRPSHLCVHRVVPGKGRCPSDGGLSPGPKTAAGTARIAAAQRARALGAVQAAASTRPCASATRLFTHGAPFQARWSVLHAIPSPMAGPAGAGYSHFSCNNAREGTPRLLVQVRDNNVDQALRVLKKKMQREGVFREMKQRKYYEKPSEKRVREQAEAVRRARKLARKKAQREGLLPKPVARTGGPGKPGGRPGRPGAGGGAGGPPRGSGFGGTR